MHFIGFFDDFLHDSRQLGKNKLFISAMLLSGQLLNTKQLKPELHCHLSFPSLPRKQIRFSEKRKGTGQLRMHRRPQQPRLGPQKKRLLSTRGQAHRCRPHPPANPFPLTQSNIKPGAVHKYFQISFLSKLLIRNISSQASNIKPTTPPANFYSGEIQ